MSGNALEGYRSFTFTRRGRVLTARIDRAASRNAVDEVLHHEFARLFHDLNDDPDSDVIVLTGADRWFCAGGDMAWFQSLIDDPKRWRAEVLPAAKRIISGLLDLEKPIVCGLNGAAAGLGASIALMCDIIIASEKAVIGDPHVKMGLVAGDGGAIIWPQLVGFARAKEMLLTGKMLTAQRAEELGLVNYVVPEAELEAKVNAMADELAGGATLAIRWTKTVVNMELRRIHAALTDAALGYETLTNESADHQEAVRAFREKRKPAFRGN